MCSMLRKTARRGRSDVPKILRRTRRCRRTRSWRPVFCAIPYPRCLTYLLRGLSLAGRLARLATNDFAPVADAFALVWLDFAELPNLGRDRSDQFLVDSLDREPSRHPFVGCRWGER